MELLVYKALGENKSLQGGIVFLDEMPHTTVVKIAKNDLKKLAKTYAIHPRKKAE